jgi:DNA-binding NarL/FixJ family response regulator
MSQQTGIRVLIVDDYAIVCEGLTAILAGQSDIEVVGTAADGKEALMLVQTTQPDVVLLDLVMPTVEDMDSMQTLRAIKQIRPTTHIILLLSMTSDEPLHAACQAGVAGTLAKDASRDHVLKMIRSTRSTKTQTVGKVFT